MKKLLSILTVSAIALSLPAASFAADKKDQAAKTGDTGKPSAEKAPATSPEAAAEKVAGEGKALPMNSRADSIDAAAKTFTHKKKDGVEVKHVVTSTTEIKNGDAAAKFEDIKVGDYVSGLRKKKSDTEYEVVKITKFGAKAEKKEGAAKPAGDKPAEKPAEKKAN